MMSIHSNKSLTNFLPSFLPGSSVISVHNPPGENDLPAVLSLLSVEVISQPPLWNGTSRRAQGIPVVEQLGQRSLGYHLHQGARLLHSLLCTDPTRRELISQEYEHRLTGPQEIQAPSRDSKTN